MSLICKGILQVLSGDSDLRYPHFTSLASKFLHPGPLEFDYSWNGELGNVHSQCLGFRYYILSCHNQPWCTTRPKVWQLPLNHVRMTLRATPLYDVVYKTSY